MEKKTLTTLDKLNDGDRFYKAGDQKKQVWTKNQSIDHQISYVTKDKERYPQKMKLNAPVVFLRNAQG